MKCDYCATENDKGAKLCAKCGAPLPEPVNLYRSSPMFYRGYIVYFLSESQAFRDVLSVQFWLGERLVETIEMTREFLRSHVPEYEDSMPFFWNLFRLSQGDAEVLRVETMNDGRPAEFEIKCIQKDSGSSIGEWINRKFSDSWEISGKDLDELAKPIDGAVE